MLWGIRRAIGNLFPYGGSKLSDQRQQIRGTQSLRGIFPSDAPASWHNLLAAGRVAWLVRRSSRFPLSLCCALAGMLAHPPGTHPHLTCVSARLQPQARVRAIGLCLRPYSLIVRRRCSHLGCCSDVANGSSLRGASQTAPHDGSDGIIWWCKWCDPSRAS